ncbi:MAG: hypothetical protein RIA09_14425 [Hoeflea sp.]|uniref:hypothetical protein n=1 Tax=Hoeflea sp. TaxID=1940281 RepID=UPI0032EB8828
MTADDALSELPQKPPFLFVDKVLGHTDLTIAAVFSYELDHPIVMAHRNVGNSIPGSVLMEQAAQTALVLAKLHTLVPAEMPLLVGALQGKFLRPVIAPSQVICRVAIVYSRSVQIGFKSELEVGGEVSARVKGACSILSASEAK